MNGITKRAAIVPCGYGTDMLLDDAMSNRE